MKLNLGCGPKKLPDYVNVDISPHFAPDLVWDLEKTPWPFQSNSVDFVLMSHVLEHVGGSAAGFVRVMRELYRVCTPGARIHVKVPHPSHDDFAADPTHVRPVTFSLLSKFDRQLNERWQSEGKADTPFALLTGVDFVSENHFVRLDDGMVERAVARGLVTASEASDLTEMNSLSRLLSNLVKQLEVDLVVRKPSGWREGEFLALGESWG